MMEPGAKDDWQAPHTQALLGPRKGQTAGGRTAPSERAASCLLSVTHPHVFLSPPCSENA